MKRRELLKGLAMSSLLFGGDFTNLKSNENSVNSQFTKPKALKVGDKVGVIAPATAVTDPEDIAKAKETLDYFGLQMILGDYVNKGQGYKTRTIQERTSDIHKMFENKEIKAVFAIRGGYGSAGILDQIDYELIKNNPKIFCGYSDITAMHLAIQKKSNLVTFHGPVLLSPFNPYTENSFKKILFSNSIGLEFDNPQGKKGFRNAFPIKELVPGVVSGKLVGGNLSLICSLMGTDYEIDTKDKILFIEDVEEPAYRIDRMLTQLKLAKKLDDAAGIIIGKCENCKNDGQGNLWDRTIPEVYESIFDGYKKPVLSGLMIGHTAEQLTLPLGIEVELNTLKGSIKLLESATI
ncbi:MAG: LD-carboxypeptidase [Candidatus Kapabacteria bacterium]|nr:LD-carboxypeptidase [Candidatus Kapabacteria bacterium]